MSELNYIAILPEILLSVAGIAIMVAIPSVKDKNQPGLGYVALSALVIAIGGTLAQWGADQITFFGMVYQDNLAIFSKLVFLVALAAIVVTSIEYLRREEILKAEFFGLLLFAGVGMCLMASSADLILTFLGLEILSIATYVMAGYRRDWMQSTESALKYFLLGAFSTAFLLYGIAFVYGATGSTKYGAIATAISSQGASASLLIGAALMIVGFGFKAAVAPFHVWTPDVYEGAPVPVTAHLAVASKAAAFVALLRILFQVLPGLSEDWQPVLWASAVLTMLLGNIAALTQTNIKRMLAYSSIAHAGYLLVGLIAHNQLGAQSVLFYLLAYAFMNLGAFALVQVVGRKGEQFTQISDYTGIGFKHPFVSVSLSVFLVSLAGIPLTAGFTGKLFLFSAAIQQEFYWLVVLAVIASAIGIYYYLRVMVVMFMQDSGGDSLPIPISPLARVVIAIMVAGTLFLGIFPGSILHLASEAVNF